MESLVSIPEHTGRQSLKKQKIKKKKPDELESVINYDDMCPICLHLMVEPIKLKCGHYFCVQCIKKAYRVLNHKCPMCRKAIYFAISNRKHEID